MKKAHIFGHIFIKNKKKKLKRRWNLSFWILNFLLTIARSFLYRLQAIALCKINYQGPVVQSVVSLTSSLRVISLTVLGDSIHNILIFFAEKM